MGEVSKKPLSQQEQLLQNFHNRQESTGSQSEDLVRDVKFMNDKNPFTGSYGVYAGVQEFNESFNKDRFKEEKGETSGSTESSGRISPNQNAGKTFQQLQDEINNISDTKKASMDRMKEDFMGVKPSEQNPLKITGETNVLNGGKEFVFGKGRSSGMNLSIDNSISNLGKNLQQNMDLDSKFDKTNNNVSSKTRGGLFGNYGKKVETRKTFDESTGRTNKQKFIDGELASDRNARQDVRRKGRSTDARAKRKAGRNK